MRKTERKARKTERKARKTERKTRKTERKAIRQHLKGPLRSALLMPIYMIIWTICIMAALILEMTWRIERRLQERKNEWRRR